MNYEDYTKIRNVCLEMSTRSKEKIEELERIRGTSDMQIHHAEIMMQYERQKTCYDVITKLNELQD